MRRQLIESAILEGNHSAFQIIAKDYLEWLSGQDHQHLQNRYFGETERLACDFYHWTCRRESQSQVA